MVISYSATECSQRALERISQNFGKDQIETIDVRVREDTSGCIGCGKCWKKQKCVFEEDGVNEALDKMKECDAVIVLSDLYYGHVHRALLDFMRRTVNCGSLMLNNLPCAFIPCAGKRKHEEAVKEIESFFRYADMLVLTAKHDHAVSGDEEKDNHVIDSLCARIRWLLQCAEAACKAEIEKPQDLYERELDYIR